MLTENKYQFTEQMEEGTFSMIQLF